MDPDQLKEPADLDLLYFLWFMSGCILFLKDFIHLHCILLFKHSEDFANIFVHYLFFNMGRVHM